MIFTYVFLKVQYLLNQTSDFDMRRLKIFVFERAIYLLKIRFTCCCLEFETSFDLDDGEDMMVQACKETNCINCKVLIPSGDRLCRVCASLPYCAGCKRWLPTGNFDPGFVVCSSCVKRQNNLFKKLAFRGLAEEIPVITTHLDADFAAFIRSNAQRITDIIQGGLDQHT